MSSVVVLAVVPMLSVLTLVAVLVVTFVADDPGPLRRRSRDTRACLRLTLDDRPGCGSRLHVDRLDLGASLDRSGRLARRSSDRIGNLGRGLRRRLWAEAGGHESDREDDGGHGAGDGDSDALDTLGHGKGPPLWF